ncbi:hypothetical protein BHM03_00059684, partial [Ensete ventricosum]
PLLLPSSPPALTLSHISHTQCPTPLLLLLSPTVAITHLLPSAPSEISDTASCTQQCRCPSLVVASSSSIVPPLQQSLPLLAVACSQPLLPYAPLSLPPSSSLAIATSSPHCQHPLPYYPPPPLAMPPSLISLLLPLFLCFSSASCGFFTPSAAHCYQLCPPCHCRQPAIGIAQPVVTKLRRCCLPYHVSGLLPPAATLPAAPSSSVDASSSTAASPASHCLLPPPSWLLLAT